MNLYVALASIAWLCLIGGYLLRRERLQHLRLVIVGIALDILVVVLLELSRGVVGVTVSEQLGIWQVAHIALSSMALVLYLPAIYFGYRLYSGDLAARKRHGQIAATALVCRTGGFAFMFSMVR